MLLGKGVNKRATIFWELSQLALRLMQICDIDGGKFTTGVVWRAQSQILRAFEAISNWVRHLLLRGLSTDSSFLLMILQL